MATIGQYLQELSGIQSAANPYPELESTLALLSNPDLVSALVRNKQEQDLRESARQFLTDVYDDPWSYSRSYPEAPTSLLSGGFGVQPWSRQPFGEMQATTDQDTALRELRRIQLQNEPSRLQAHQRSFMSNPFAQGAAEALRRTSGDRPARYLNPLGQAQFSRLDTDAQQRLQGEASVFGRGRNRFLTDIKSNTPRGGGARRPRSEFMRV